MLKHKLLPIKFLIIFAILHSCSQREEPVQGTFKNFPYELSLASIKPDVIYPNTFYFWDIGIIDSVIIGYNFVDRNLPLIHLFDKNNFKFISSVIMVGKGPSEVNIPGKFWIDRENRKIFIQDAGKYANLEINFDDILLGSKSFSRFVPQNQNHETFLVTQRFTVNKQVIQSGMDGENILTITDEYGNIINKIGLHFLSISNRDIMYYNQMMDHNFTIHPSKNYYAVSYNFFDRITCIDTNGNQVFSLVGPDNISPQYDKKINKYRFNSIRTKRSYYGIASDEKYIFVKYLNQPLYNEGSKIMNRSKIIHVFSWDGKPVAKLHLEKEIDYNFVIDNQRLIGTDGLSDIPWVIYDLSKTELYN